MNRRRFLRMLGLAPVAAVPAAGVAALGSGVTLTAGGMTPFEVENGVVYMEGVVAEDVDGSVSLATERVSQAYAAQFHDARRRGLI